MQYEHFRILEIIRATATDKVLPSSFTSSSSSAPISPWIVADMMAGVGPFAVPLGMTQVSVPIETNPPETSTSTDTSTNNKKNNKKPQFRVVAPVMVHANGKP